MKKRHYKKEIYLTGFYKAQINYLKKKFRKINFIHEKKITNKECGNRWNCCGL